MTCSPADFRFCPSCGQPLAETRHAGRIRPRCPGCQRIFYHNPAVGVAVVVIQEDQILLGRRASGRYAGTWCIPCGYVEWGEEIRQAAAREFAEETGLIVQVGEVVAVHSNFHDRRRLTVGLWFAGTVVGGELRADDDLDRVAFFSFTALPPDLAFPTDRLVLAELYRKRVLDPPVR